MVDLKKEYWPAGNCRILIRRGSPDQIIGNKAIRGKAAISYRLRKLSAITGPNKMSNITMAYTVKSIQADLNRVYGRDEIKVEEVSEALEEAVKAQRCPVWTREVHIEQVKGADYAEKDAKVLELTSEVERLKEELSRKK